VIGWSERVDLPEWGIRGIRAKIDTGASSSALHVENLVQLEHGRARFDVIVARGSRRRIVHVEAPVHRHGRVRSSSGHASQRLFVTTTLRLGPVERSIEINLVDRDLMRYRMLLGRSALAGDFWIDAARTGVIGKRAGRRTRGG
jgi:hypothetical protein